MIGGGGGGDGERGGIAAQAWTGNYLYQDWIQ